MCVFSLNSMKSSLSSKSILLQSHRFFPTGFICDPPQLWKGSQVVWIFTMCQILLDTKPANARDRKRYSWDLEH